ncbi:AmmeMemoRadiSam system protein B [Parasulfuritortus cantonensis]|uniref:MEMO1 family protein EZJ19_10135 n=1 Tax=Parasulfuritortus cantonensis TaxID=2528202 RepID=A0A4R1B9E0_9PROT|nr:AmmeMemoRadiSam system protein B [Parasulfuritortus cantonensis]TCJ13507.1 AmmeMemoRadiSam system protein B [Parasulfuritortus cantonensis]
MLQVRAPVVAGMFYPGEGSALKGDIAAMLAAAKPTELIPKAIIAPHAGYIYSGPIAASAYAALAPLRERIRRVVLLGPVHRVWTAGLALPGVDAFDTPLGRVELDREAIRSLADLPQVETNPAAHAMEHSLEVQLPFLQAVLADFKLVPLAVGGASPRQVAEVLERLWGGPETLIVVSSDLSHYQPYALARQADAGTAEAILHLRSDLVGEMACGCHPINGLLVAAGHKGLKAHLLDLRNSGDTAGDRARVVGYGAFAFTEEPVS